MHPGKAADLKSGGPRYHGRCQRARSFSAFSFSCRIIWAMSERTCFRRQGLASQRTETTTSLLTGAGGADVTLFGMSAPADSDGRMHAGKTRRHVCATHLTEAFSAVCLLLSAYCSLRGWRPIDIQKRAYTRSAKIYNREVMAKLVIDISEAEATRDFRSLLVRVRAGAEVVIKDGSQPIAVVRPAEPLVRRLSESLGLAREHGSTATLDADFAKDVEAGVEAHRESLNPPAWD